MTKEEDTLDTGRLGDIQKRLGKSLPNDWVLTTLGEAFKWGSGGTPKRTDTRFYGGNIPWLIIGDLNDGVVTDSQTTITEEGLKESSTKWVEPGSILLAMYGSIGKLGIAGRRLTTNQAIAFTKPDPVDAKYLFYYLMYTRGDLASLGKGATQKNISQTVIKAFPFVLAPQGQQKRIVAEIEKQFSRLDEAVANLKRVKANLKRYKAAVLKAAVEGRLVETEAELARKKPPLPLGEGGGEGASYETGAQLLQRILETRRSQWLASAEKAGRKGKGKYKEPVAPDTTDLSELPEGWVWANFDQVTERVTKGSSPNWQGFEYCDKGIPFVRSQNVGWGVTDLSDVAFLPPAFNEVEKKSVLREGDVLLNIVGASIGRAAIAPSTVEGGNVNQAVAVIRLLESGVSNQFALLYLLSAQTQRRIHSEKVDVARANFSLEDIRDMPLTLPPYAEQHRIVTEVERRLSLVREVESQVEANSRRSDRLRQSILAEAFSGQILRKSDISESAMIAVTG